MTDQEAVDAFSMYLEISRGRRPRTLEAYRMALGRLREFLQGKPLLQADELELETFSGIWLHKRGVVARSRKPYVSAVKGFYAWAKSRGLRSGNPAGGLVHPKTGKKLPEALSLASAEKLMWAPDLNTFAGVRDAAMLGLLIGCGLRVSGLVQLNAGDVRNAQIGNQVRLVLRVVEKGEKERIVPVPRETEMLLRLYMDHEELQELDRAIEVGGHEDLVLFVNQRNTRVPAHEYRGEATRISRKSVWKLIQSYGDKAGVPARERHPHAFRHLFGTELAEDDVDLILRQELLGHSDPKSTAIYTAMSIRRKAKTVDGSNPMGKIRTPVTELLRRL